KILPNVMRCFSSRIISFTLPKTQHLYSKHTRVVFYKFFPVNKQSYRSGNSTELSADINPFFSLYPMTNWRGTNITNSSSSVPPHFRHSVLAPASKASTCLEYWDTTNH